MAETGEGRTVAFETDNLAVTRRELATIAGALLVLVSLPLPWFSAFGRSASGLEATWLSPAIAVGAVVAIALAVPDAWPRLRYTVVSLIGVAFAALGIILLLGTRGAGAGIGLLVFVAGGFLVAGGGYGSLVREMPTLYATALVCCSSLLTLVLALVIV